MKRVVTSTISTRKDKKQATDISRSSFDFKIPFHIETVACLEIETTQLYLKGDNNRFDNRKRLKMSLVSSVSTLILSLLAKAGVGRKDFRSAPETVADRF